MKSHPEPIVAGVKVARQFAIRLKDIPPPNPSGRAVLGALHYVAQNHSVLKLVVVVPSPHCFRSEFGRRDFVAAFLVGVASVHRFRFEIW